MSTADATWSPVAGVTVSTGPVLRVWALALATYGVGDGVTTAAVVWASPLHREANPVVSAAIDAFGGGGLVGLKLAAIGVCLAVSLWGSTDDDQFTCYLPPVTLALVGTVTTLLNLKLLL
ncbi:MAG: hypothetical protein V5A28_15585 [Haloarculaceae archaeon]